MTVVTWDPTVAQVADPDTIWGPFDPVFEETLAPGGGGLIDSGGSATSLAACDPFRVGTPYVLEAGPFARQGIRGSATTGKLIWQPGVYLPNRQFTVELFLRCDEDWLDEAGDVCFLSFGNPNPGLDSQNLSVYWSAGLEVLVAQTSQFQTVAARETRTVSGAGSGAYQAGDWHSVAVTLNPAGTMTLYLDGVSRGTPQTVTPPLVRSQGERNGGMLLYPGVNVNGGSDNWTVAEVRISRVCRVPGVPVDVSATNTVTFTDAPTGDELNPYLRGGVHSFAVGQTATEAVAGTKVAIGRTDKFMSAVRIKAGAPDATRPTLGHSGAFSYNWGPVDNTVAFWQHLGRALYFGIDSCPQILGGSVAPFSAADCADPTKLVGTGGYATETPSSFADFATMAADLVYHVEVELAADVWGWSFWNEPDGGSFWTGTPTQLFDLYAAVSAAVRAAVPSVNLGSHELTHASDGYAVWGDPFIAYCATNDVLFGFFPFHSYSGDIGMAAAFARMVAASAATHGLGYTPPVVIGEFGWEATNMHGGIHPWNDRYMTLNDWSGSFLAAAMVVGQQAHLGALMFYWLDADEPPMTGFESNVLQAPTHPWSGLNVYEMWQLLAGDLLTMSASDLEGGVLPLATLGADGKCRILLVNHKYRMERTTDVAVTLSSAFASGTVDTHHLIDADHSNYYDQGGGAGTLETVTAPSVSAGTVTLTMEPRSVHLLTVTAGEAPALPVWAVFASAT